MSCAVHSLKGLITGRELEMT